MKGKVQPISSKFQLESTIRRMYSAPRTEPTIFSPLKHQRGTHSKSSHTNDHSCQKFYWSLAFIVSLSITSPLSSYEWVNMIVKRTGRNQNRILYLPSHLQIDITMGLHWRRGKELLLIRVWHDGKLYCFPTFVCSPSSLFLSPTPCREDNCSPHSRWAGPCEFLWPIEC